MLALKNLRTSETRLVGSKHEHRLLPIELGHPTTVTSADVPAGLTTENVAVVEMPGSRFTSLSGGDFPLSDWLAAFNVVKDRYGDCFDFVVFFTDSRLPRIPYSGYHRGVYNEVTGINRGTYNSRTTWGTERLQSQIWMGRFSLGTLLQEIGHRWGSFVRYRLTSTGSLQTALILPGGGHWARPFDDGNSPMDYDEERHIRQSPTTWLREPISGFEFAYSNFDLYIMGMMNPGEVGRFTLIRNYREVGPPLPGGRQLISGRALNLSVGNVIWAEGVRNPTQVGSQKNFRAAFVVVTGDARTLDELFVKKVEILRQQLGRYFQVATQSRTCLDARLCCGHTISRSGTVKMRLVANRITRSPFIYHGLGPIPVKVEADFESTIGGKPIDVWSREETPDISTGVQQLSAQVNRDPTDGRFVIVPQAKGRTLNLVIRWWASTIS